jgi:hypothetical protein
VTASSAPAAISPADPIASTPATTAVRPRRPPDDRIAAIVAVTGSVASNVTNSSHIGSCVSPTNTARLRP